MTKQFDKSEELADFESRLGELNPIKLNAKASTWQKFYQNSGFSFADAVLAFEYIRLNSDRLVDLQVEFEDSDESDNEAEENFKDIVSQFLHAFRIVMALGSDASLKANCLDELLEIWPFDMCSELSDDLSQVAVIHHPQLNQVLVRYFEQRHFGMISNIILVNAVATAMENLTVTYPEHPESRRMFELLTNVVRDPVLFHSENVLVVSLMLANHPWTAQEDVRNIKRVFDAEYVAPLGVRFEDVQLHSNELKSYACSLPTENKWIADIPYSNERFFRAISWLGFQGREEWYRLSMLGSLLDPFNNKGIVGFCMNAEEFARECESETPLLAEGQKRALETLFQEFAEECLKNSEHSLNWLYPQWIPNGELPVLETVASMGLNSFLVAFDGWEDGIDQGSHNHAVIKDFLVECTRIQETLLQRRELEPKQIVKALDTLHELWASRFHAFKEACLDEKRERGLPMFMPPEASLEDFWKQVLADTETVYV